MVKKICIGVIGIQGAISEHIASTEKALKETNTLGEVIKITHKQEINNINALIIPGGESSTISRILYKSGLHDAISKKIKENNLPIMGTCAGCILLASRINNNIKNIKLLSAMDMHVKRNAFGRQKESFEKKIDIKGFSKQYNAIFIRAPIITKVWGNCEILSKVDKKIIMARQDNLLALSFHPELIPDLRIHKYFLNMI